ncbi:MAG: MarR family transcriptional regulator, partial [Acidobacteria bacterium]|nr:MarR family transcriptional regulator [Acidobacteriota bacterium]
MSETAAAEIRRDFLSSAHVFANALRRVFEMEILREIAGDSLTFSQLKLLFLGFETGGHTIGDAAEFLGVSNAAASKTVEKLVQRNWLSRVETLGDRRSSQLSLTAKSRELLEGYEAARHRKAVAVLDPLELEELQRTAELLDRLAALIVKHSTRPEETCLQCEIFYREQCRFGELSRLECFYKRHKA